MFQGCSQRVKINEGMRGVRGNGTRVRERKRGSEYMSSKVGGWRRKAGGMEHGRHRVGGSVETSITMFALYAL